MQRRNLGTCLAGLVLAAQAALADVNVPAVYLRQEVDLPPTLSNLDPVPGDLGEIGARLGLADNMTTGSFLGQSYALEVISIPVGGDLIASARNALEQSPFLILDAPASDQLTVADLPEAQSALLFNASSADMNLRGEDCRSNLFHTLPSYQMRSDALMQFARFKKWESLPLVAGTHPQDKAFAEALRQSAAKFGLRIEGEKSWVFDADMRRNASQEVPLFTQDFGDYDILLIADELHDFGRYIAYNTWQPRPVAGSEGLVPTAWAPVVEQWGAAQLQSRFHDLAARPMHPQDYAAWAAMRSIGEAVTRTNSDDPAVLRAFILSEKFELAGFKGRPLSFRSWNGQLRQPIPLVTPRALVAQAPLEGYLHQRNELDTLGLDEPESACEAFR
ncbi:branched-chain amino acid ABC transporter substrate-binding protein [Ruegeria sediminis]|uniref:Branched-chain amino acid ABC transporter substrate-binding protein n=1 Tax=Ruegeria sediminis TaxID=2583820 RepID=A0ABY2X1H7_9RHOB|nr:ABC transporter substrate-binding protein [Ruegeria sediminis]TMV09100.1 branched-chain amino acid ABC transporter substrate-binding protein [Ruegeria sediminis]